ncbi:WD repeat-containing protein 74 [Bienertia sinuspersici]
MPRTTTIETPGCPPLRALTFDVIGLVKVIESRSKQNGIPKVVERWGDPDSSKAVLAASIHDSKSNPLLAVARKNGVIEGLSPSTGKSCFSIANDGSGTSPTEDPIVGLHLFKKQTVESSPRACTLLTCTTKGKASLQRVEYIVSEADSASCATSDTWNVCGSGEIRCSKVHAEECYSVFGGKGVELNMWDLEKTTKIWSAKSPPKNSLGIFAPTCFTSLTFLSMDDHRKVVAGTNNHQVRLYDISAQRRPVLSIDFRETPIKAVTEDLDGNTIYLGNGAGDLASFDIRTGKLLGCFFGKCSGSIRSIARHPELSLIASCGLDSYLRIWDIKSRQLLSSVFLKQHLTNVVFDSNFSDEETTTVATDPHKGELQVSNEEQSLHEDDALPVKRKKSYKDRSEGKKKNLSEESKRRDSW